MQRLVSEGNYYNKGAIIDRSLYIVRQGESLYNFVFLEIISLTCINISHSPGIPSSAIVRTLCTTHIDSEVIASLRAAIALGSVVKIVSDANQFFIETIARNDGALDVFSEVITNPAWIDDSGMLCIMCRYHTIPYRRPAPHPAVLAHTA